MTEEVGGTSSKTHSGLIHLLKSKGWTNKNQGYTNVNIKGTFFGGLFKKKLFQVTLRNKGIEIIVIFDNVDGKVNFEYKYKVRIGATETEWTDIKDFKNVNKQIRDNNLNEILN